MNTSNIIALHYFGDHFEKSSNPLNNMNYARIKYECDPMQHITHTHKH